MDRKVKANGRVTGGVSTPGAGDSAHRPVRARAGRKGDDPSPISAKRQVTLPVDVMRKAGIEPGDRVWITSDRPGSIRLEMQAASPWDEAIGAFTGTWDDFDLRAERDTWQR